MLNILGIIYYTLTLLIYPPRTALTATDSTFRWPLLLSPWVNILGSKGTIPYLIKYLQPFICTSSSRPIHEVVPFRSLVPHGLRKSCLANHYIDSDVHVVHSFKTPLWEIHIGNMWSYLHSNPWYLRCLPVIAKAPSSHYAPKELTEPRVIMLASYVGNRLDDRACIQLDVTLTISHGSLIVLDQNFCFKKFMNSNIHQSKRQPTVWAPF